MPNFTTTTTITTDRGESLTASKTGNYIDVFNIRQEVDNTNAFITLIAGGSKSQGTLEDCKSLIIKNAIVYGFIVSFLYTLCSLASYIDIAACLVSLLFLSKLTM